MPSPRVALIEDSRIRYLAVAQGAGALLGLIAARGWAAIAPGVIGPLGMSVALAYLCLAFVASLLLWHRQPVGIPLSLVVQVPQIFVVLDPGATFYFLAGLFARLCLSADGISLGVGGGGVAEATALYGPVPGRLGSDFHLTFTQRFQPPTGATRYCLNILGALISLRLMREWAREDGASSEGRPAHDESPAA